MAFAKKKTDKASVKASGSNYINASGVYPLTILAAFVTTSASGSEVIDFFVESNGQNQVLYGNLRITNKTGPDGEPVVNEIGDKTFNHLIVVSDLDEVSMPVEMELPIGKDGKDKIVSVLEDFADVEVQVRIQLEYSMYNGKIQEKKVIRDFYRIGDGATAEEIVNESEAGLGLEKDMKYADNITYKDDLTPEDIAKWVAGGRTGGASGGTKGTAKKAPSFAAKRFSNKNAK